MKYWAKAGVERQHGKFRYHVTLFRDVRVLLLFTLPSAHTDALWSPEVH